jgi:WD40-like Beta Propeller Repeat
MGGHARWSPDGEWIAFTAQTQGSRANAYVVPADGGTPSPIGSGQKSYAYPEWSPDGRSILFTVIGEGRPPKMELQILDRSTGSAVPLPGSEGMLHGYWSPDGKCIAAVRYFPSAQASLFEFSTRKWKPLPMPFDEDMRWSRDGRYIYFVAGENISRLRLNEFTQSKVASIAKFLGEHYLGFAPDKSLVVEHDLSSSQIYAFELEGGARADVVR